MNRRQTFKRAAALGLIGTFLETSAMANTVTPASSQAKLPFTDASDILARLTDREIPGAVQYDARMRALITAAALTPLNAPSVAKHAFEKAIEAGVSALDLREAVMQAMAYSGLPSVITMLESLNTVLSEAGLPFPEEKAAVVADQDRFQKGLAEQKGIFGPVIDQIHANAKPDERFLMVDLLTGFCFGDTYTRTVLSLKERELLTFVVIAAMSGCEPQVKAHATGNILVGNTRRMLIDAIVVMLPYIGFPKALNALGMVNEAAPAGK